MEPHSKITSLAPGGPVGKRGFPANIVALGAVSLLMGISSTMILGLLPAFLVKVLGASALWVGTIEGIAEATASITKIFSGALSDWIGKRKPLVIAGYGLSALVKPLFPLSQTVFDVLIARVIDRIGKGIRDAPRDALLADITVDQSRGSAFGLRHALFSAGAVLGPLMAIGLMVLSQDDFRLVYWIAVVPALLCVVVLVLQVDEPIPDHQPKAARAKFELKKLKQLSPAFWRIVAFSAVLSLARFSQAFLLLKAVSVGVDAAFVPLILVLVFTVYATSSYPFGILADRLGRGLLLGLGVTILVIAESVLGVADSASATAFGAALWGLQMGIIQGLLGAMIASVVPRSLRGLAFGIYDLVIGLAALAASVMAGVLWVAGGAMMTFAVGGLFAATAGGMLLIGWNQPAPRPDDSA